MEGWAQKGHQDVGCPGPKRDVVKGFSDRRQGEEGVWYGSRRGVAGGIPTRVWLEGTLNVHRCRPGLSDHIVEFRVPRQLPALPVEAQGGREVPGAPPSPPAAKRRQPRVVPRVATRRAGLSTLRESRTASQQNNGTPPPSFRAGSTLAAEGREGRARRVFGGGGDAGWDQIPSRSRAGAPTLEAVRRIQFRASASAVGGARDRTP